MWQRLIPVTQFRLPVAIWVTWATGPHHSAPIPSAVLFSCLAPAAREHREGIGAFLFHWPLVNLDFPTSACALPVPSA